jgi:hypothetical protein
MEKSQLRQIIKEEIQNVLKENLHKIKVNDTKNFLKDWEIKKKEFTKNIEDLKSAYKKEHGL